MPCALLFQPALCPVLSGIWAGWGGRNRPLNNITGFSKPCIWIVSANSLKSECKLKIPGDILAGSVRGFSDKCPAQDKNSQQQLKQKQDLAQITTVFKTQAEFCNDHYEQRHYEELLPAATWNLSHKVPNQTDVMLKLEDNPPQLYYRSFSTQRSVKLYARFFMNSSARAIIQPVITSDSRFLSVHMRPLDEQRLFFV